MSENDQEQNDAVSKVLKARGFLVTVKAVIYYIKWSGRKGDKQENFQEK